MNKELTNKIADVVLGIITTIVMIATFIGLFAGNSNPGDNPIKIVMCLGLPVLVIVNLILAIAWGIRKNILAIAPAVCFLMCWGFIGTIFQFRGESNAKKSKLNIATYNVRLFNNETKGVTAASVLANMKREKVDIICLQEYKDDVNGSNGPTFEKMCENDYPYIAEGRGDMRIYSKLPIVGFDKIDFGETNNSAMWADVELPNKKIIRVYNVHMQSTSINSSLKTLKSGAVSNNKNRFVIDNFCHGMAERGAQAEKTEESIADCKTPVLVCGDFNDTPYSYTYKTLLRNLEDGFKTCGSGFNHTYKGMKSLLRIDYIFHSKELEGVYYYTRSLEYSDHDPVFMRLNY